MQTVIPKLKLQTLESLMNGYKDVSSLSYLDIDYDTISRAVVLNFGWADPPSDKGWSETIHQYPKDSTVEIGVLSHEANSDPEDIQFGGFLTVLGEDASPSMFYLEEKPPCALADTIAQKQHVSKPLLAIILSSLLPPQAPRPRNPTH